MMVTANEVEGLVQFRASWAPIAQSPRRRRLAIDVDEELQRRAGLRGPLDPPYRQCASIMSAFSGEDARGDPCAFRQGP